MIASAVVSLSGQPTWDPAYLTRSTFQWPGGNTRIASLGELAVSRMPDSWVDRDVPVITPSGLDPVVGGIRRRSRKHRGPVLQVRSSSERGVHPGDLLIPLAPEMPALLVRPDLIGSMVSPSFLALRPREGLGLWLWGVLSSRTGRAARTYVAASAPSSNSSRSALLELQVPLPPAQQDLSLSLMERLARIELHTHRPEEEATETWWRIADLRGGDWKLQLATPTPSALDDGVPLSDLCAEIIRGRPVAKEAISNRSAPDLLPLTDISVIGGKMPSRWVSLGPKLPIIAHPGDVLVAAVGNRPHAFMVREATAVDRNLWLLRLRNAEDGPGLVRYLNGETGYGVRQLLLTGAFIPGLRKDNLSGLPVPLAALDSRGWDEPLVPLDIQLEQALWS